MVRPSLRSRDAQISGVVEPDTGGLGRPVGEGEPVSSVCTEGVAPIEDDTASLRARDVCLREGTTSGFISADPFPSIKIATAEGTAKPRLP